MTRPIYEKPADLAAEAQVAAQLANHWGCKMEKLPKFYRTDWAIAVGQTIKGFVEIKCRNNTRYKYDTYMLSLLKWSENVQLAITTGIPFVLAVQWTDSVGYLKVDESNYRHIQSKCSFSMGGRTDRGDSQDMEPVIHIPVGMFHKVENMA